MNNNLRKFHIQINNFIRISKSSLTSKSVLSHIDSTKSLPCMVDVSNKTDTMRSATAKAFITLPNEAFSLLNSDTVDKNKHMEINSAKGPVFSTAIIAGIMAAKKTSDLIPFCHTIHLSHCNITIDVYNELERTLLITCTVKTVNTTGVEMEALVGASTTALCVYDMLKAISHEIVINNIHLVNKVGGKRNVNNGIEIK